MTPGITPQPPLALADAGRGREGPQRSCPEDLSPGLRCRGTVLLGAQAWTFGSCRATLMRWQTALLKSGFYCKVMEADTGAWPSSSTVDCSPRKGRDCLRGKLS